MVNRYGKTTNRYEKCGNCNFAKVLIFALVASLLCLFSGGGAVCDKNADASNYFIISINCRAYIVIDLQHKLSFVPTGWEEYTNSEALGDDLCVAQKTHEKGNNVGYVSTTIELPINELNACYAGIGYTIKNLVVRGGSLNGTTYALGADGANPTVTLAKYYFDSSYDCWKGTDSDSYHVECFILDVVWENNLKFKCDNYSAQNYMIYVSSGTADNIIMQIVPTSGEFGTVLPYIKESEYSSYQYVVHFVFGYYGRITFETSTADSETDDNITVSGRRVTLDTLTETTITYTLATPNINSSLII